MLLIKITMGHHTFPKPIEIYSPQGKLTGEKAKMVGPGHCLKVSQADYDKFFYYRSDILGKSEAPKAPATPDPEPKEDVLKGLVFDPAVLETETVPKLREICKALGCKGYSNAREATLIAKIMDKAPAGDEEMPAPEWSIDRLKAYLDEAELEYNTEDPAELAALAQAHYIQADSK